jgi:hypothetical protein
MRRPIRIDRIRLALAIMACLFSGAFLHPRLAEKTRGAELSATPTPRPRARRTVSAPRPARSAGFAHDRQPHRMACDSCHKFPSANWNKVRTKDAFPDITDFPRHESCLSCHRQQFFKGTPPAICSTCHTNPGPRDSSRHAFPNPREIFDLTARGKQAISDFQIYFPHDKHLDVVGDNLLDRRRTGGVYFVNARMKRAEGESCAICHQTMNPQGDADDEYLTKPPPKLGDDFWLKKGTFKSTPTSHASCFTCHSAETGILPAPTDCATCHKLAGPAVKADFDPKMLTAMKIDERATMLAWRRRDSAGKFRHEWFSHNELACATCHDAAAIRTTDPLTKKVKVLSCGGDGTGCHITATADDGGALNFEIDEKKKNVKFECVKCHLSFGRSPIPASHAEAVSKLAGK